MIQYDICRDNPFSDQKREKEVFLEGPAFRNLYKDWHAYSTLYFSTDKRSTISHTNARLRWDECPRQLVDP